jgi:hypothetical protein
MIGFSATGSARWRQEGVGEVCLQPYVAHHADPANGLLRILRTKLQHAVYLAGPEGAAHMYELPSGSDDPIWLVQNELGSWTAMFASDY